MTNYAERLRALIEADSIPMSDAWGRLLDDLQMRDNATLSAPVIFPEALEEAVRRSGPFGMSYAASMLEASFVISPRIHFKKTVKGLDVYRGSELVGDIYHWVAGSLWFPNIIGHPWGDRAGIEGEMKARTIVQSILDQPA